MRFQGIDFRPVLSTSFDACHRTQTHLAPVPSRVRPHVSISPALPEALASWGILLPDGIRPDRLLAPSGESRRGLPRSVYPFLRDVRLVLYAVSLIHIEWKLCDGSPHSQLGTCPVWACLRLLRQTSADLAGSNSRRFKHTFVA